MGEVEVISLLIIVDYSKAERAFQCKFINAQSGSVKGNELKPNNSAAFPSIAHRKEFAKTCLISSNGVQVQLVLEFFETFHVWRSPRLRNLIWNSIINQTLLVYEFMACPQLHLQWELFYSLKISRKFIKQHTTKKNWTSLQRLRSSRMSHINFHALNLPHRITWWEMINYLWIYRRAIHHLWRKKSFQLNRLK